MKNISKILFLMMLAVAAASFVGCKYCDESDPSSDCYVQPPVAELEHSGAITTNTTWAANTIHFIKGRVWVESGATLTIEKGAIVKGRTGTEANASALIIAKGGKLMAEGTADMPIIFTSELDNIALGQKTGTNLTGNDREKWGGLIILGQAKISAENGDISAQIEGIPATATYGAFGGDNDADNSGVLTYVSIRHGGALIGEGNEINGLTLGGVGSGTVINHVEIVATLDDGIEFFGGSVNVQNALVYNHGDDGIDIDFNYSGTVNNFIVMHGGDTDEGLEIDGPEGTTHTSGLFTLKNGTIISTDGKGSAADLKSKAQGTIENCSFAGYSGKYIKFRASFGDTTNCTSKSDAYAYFIAATPKLIVKNNDLGASSLTAMASGYTASCVSCGCFDSAAETALDALMATSGNALNTASSKGANKSEFTGWSWTSVNNKL